MQVVESILKLNISEALTTVESTMTKLRNSFKLAILIFFFFETIHTASKQWI